MKSLWRDGDNRREVELTRLDAGRWRVRVGASEFELGAERLPDGRLRLTTDAGTTVALVTAAGSRRFVRLGALDFVVDRDAGGEPRSGAALAGGLEAPMPGAVSRVLVKAGDAVVKGQPLVAVEAMKMEHLIRAPRDGVVGQVRVTAGEMVTPGSALVELVEEPGR